MLFICEFTSWWKLYFVLCYWTFTKKIFFVTSERENFSTVSYFTCTQYYRATSYQQNSPSSCVHFQKPIKKMPSITITPLYIKFKACYNEEAPLCAILNIVNHRAYVITYTSKIINYTFHAGAIFQATLQSYREHFQIFVFPAQAIFLEISRKDIYVYIFEIFCLL